jgi:hypothetical protein
MQARNETMAQMDVEYHGGLHLKESLLWFDAEEAKELCFISSALVPGAWRHKKIITTSETGDLLAAIGAAHGRGRRAHQPQTLVTPYRRPFALGRLGLELFPSGHALGAASLKVELGGQTTVYAGHIDTRRSELIERLEARHCDLLVLPCAEQIGAPITEQELEARLISFVEGALEHLQVPVILCPPVGAAPRLVHVMAKAGIAVRVHRTIMAVLRVSASHRRLPDLSRVRRYRGMLDVARRPEALVWPVALRSSPALARLSRARLALVSAKAADPEYRAKMQCEENIVLGEHPAAREIAEYVKACSPSRLVLVGQPSEALSRELDALDLPISRVGPAHQLSLFDEF